MFIHALPNPDYYQCNVFLDGEGIIRVVVPGRPVYRSMSGTSGEKLPRVSTAFCLNPLVAADVSQTPFWFRNQFKR